MMDQTNILIIDLDEEYLMMLTLKFLKAMGGFASITVINDKEILNDYLKEPHKIDVLIINENLYSTDFEKYNITRIFYLVENSESMLSYKNNFNKIYKYSNVEDIFIRVSSISNIAVSKNKSACKIIMIYSPIGGCGKTLTAISLAKTLSNINKKVLYLSVESLHSYSYFLSNKGYLNNNFDRALSMQNERILELFCDSLQTEDFDYLLPFEQSPVSLGITMDNYNYLLNKIREHSMYEYIILDTSSEFNIDKIKYMSISDKVIIITRKDGLSRVKINSFLRNIDYHNNNKFIFLSNQYQDVTSDLDSKEIREDDLTIDYYLKDMSNEDIKSGKYDEVFQKLAFNLI